MSLLERTTSSFTEVYLLFYLYIIKNFMGKESQPLWRLCHVHVLISVFIWHLIGDQDH